MVSLVVLARLRLVAGASLAAPMVSLVVLARDVAVTLASRERRCA